MCSQVYLKFIDIRDKMIFTLARSRGIVPSSLFMTGFNKIEDHPIGRGGFADVWKGLSHSTHDKDVALKILRPISTSGRGSNSLREVSNH